MFSSLASFLPSALHLNSNQDLPRPDIADETITEDEDEADGRTVPPKQEVQQQPGAKGKDKDGKTPSEVFQLVPPNCKPPSGVTPGGADSATTPTSANSTKSTDTDGVSLSRTSSNRSEVSFNAGSYGSSTTSFSSVASTSTSSTTRRTIIPLYNLQAHNVLTNVIVDAGTDAKIARFQKRGIELIDLALLEPVEVWGEGGKEKDARRESMRISVDEMGAMMTNLSTRGSLLSARSIGTFLQPGSRPVTPSATSSVVSLQSTAHSAIQAPQAQTAAKGHQLVHSSSRRILDSNSATPMPSSPTPMAMVPSPDVMPPSSPPAKRNIFGKLFNKRPSPVPQPQQQPQVIQSSYEDDDMPSFSIIARDFDTRKRPTPLSQAATPASPTSPMSQQTTPTQSHPTPSRTKIEQPTSPTPTVAPVKVEKVEKEKGHGRNLSLTAITNPLKATLKNNKNRLSAVVHGGSSRGEEGGNGNGVDVRKRDASPNPSVSSRSRSRLSLIGIGGGSVVDLDSTNGNGNGNGNGQGGYPLQLTQSQAQTEVLNLKQQQLQLRPPVLGIQPTFVSSSSSSNGNGMTSPGPLSPRASEDPGQILHGQRALMYVWLVRRWMKRRPSAFGDTGFFGNVVGLAGGSNKAHAQHGHAALPHHSGHGHEASGSAPGSLVYGGVEVRFEWKRAKAKEGRRKSRRGRASTSRGAGGAESDGEVERASVRERTREREDPKERLKSEERKKHRMSTGSLSTTTTNAASDEGDPVQGRKLQREGTKGEGKESDDGDESDAEDSETPWVCTLKLRRASSPNTSGAGGVLSPTGSMYSGKAPPLGLALGAPGLVAVVQPQVLRIKVGTLSPTPHHPKVVAMLKVPFPLPDVEVDRMGVVKRKLVGGNSNGSPEGERTPYDGLVLTAEEIKDVVCSTGLWLVVREGFGGWEG
ncbi:hypothetical protein B0H34DRAFT_784135 [Crassisporium funariophilum]|nr:hypothetical protein B0H34DRAFT_784135 [Crassisporium funariophilum]